MVIVRRILLPAILLSLFTPIMSCQSNEPAIVEPSVVPSTPSTGTDLTSIPLPEALTNGRPTLAEFGRGTCIPCQAMKPILEELAVEYQDRLNVAIVSVDEYNILTRYYRIMAIPTQIGFDSDGQEVFRHVGFWEKDEIITELSKLGIN
ncbi:MAG: thioredoxin family protein [Dehalococcoidales bacterium]|nr:thioredoxin family protein [Dehalococcoidales bacterium]